MISTTSTTIYHQKRLVYIIVAVAAIGGLLFGFDTSVIAGATPFIQREFHASDWQIELVVSICVLGALFGALLSGRITDIYGRKRVLIATGFLFVFGSLFAAFSQNIEWLAFGRLMLGFAIGIASYATPLFIAEIAPAERRGSLVLWNGAFLTGGQVIAFMVGYYFTSSGNWRAMILIGVIPAILLLVGMMFMPYSPKWLVVKGRKEEAIKTLERLRTHPEIALLELKDLEENLNVSKPKFRDIFSKNVRPVLWIGLAIGIFQQFFGINTVMYYGPHIMQHIGLSGDETQMLGTLGLGAVNFVFTIVTILFIDRIGRRRFLLIGSMMASLSLFAMIVFLSYVKTSWAPYVALMFLLFYVIGYCISVGSLFWLIIAEIFPLHLRGACMSFVAGIQWGANFIVAATFLTILNALGLEFTFSIYGFVALIAFVYIYKYVPETRGVSLERIEHDLNNGVPTRYLGKEMLALPQ